MHAVCVMCCVKKLQNCKADITRQTCVIYFISVIFNLIQIIDNYAAG